ncbi:DEAD/DEAH box helicase [Streptomyces sp. NBC_00083]|uniref:DEAD/DEAH box helicase n=1 Tax=Streptomyces sp. NBC_00083 TaxID=2975647 RepID=UPI00224E9626|nr:DEAD/DEAH box helicase [Streptomyces sp. NBC_00083]MCX5385490.1 DEAD/DEAH box helicase [Streptomyces sp. NBC_00083]
MTTFRELGILPETAEALEAVGIVSPFPIQELTLPVALSGADIIGQAKTGTGKTLGFGLPLLERVTVPADVEAGRATTAQLTNTPQALVVVPTRELCQQVTNDLLTAGKVRNVRVLAIYGGRAYEPQVEALKKGVDVIVGTPGRLLDLAGQKKLDLSHVKALVLDEADEMLDLGFLPDVEKIIQHLPPKRQTMLFSATMPGAVIGLARRYMSQPTHIRATSPDDEGTTVANTEQFVYRAHSMDKPEMVARILQAEGRGLAMIFCRTKRTAADIAEQLAKRGFASGAVHGDLGQGAREQALRAFRNGKVDVLVCTDVAARGIDVEGVTHVINYQSPEEEKTYLHRIGRTGRAGKKGIAITLVDWDDIPRWQLINKALDLKFPDPPETYSTSPHLFEELKIPAGTKGVLPRGARTRAGLAAEEVEDLGETGGRGRKSAAAAPVVTEERPERTRTPRQRRRTRGGSQAEAVETVPAPAAAPAVDAVETGTEPRTPRRRRRTRVGAPSSAPQAAAAPVAQAAAPAARVAVAEPVAARAKAEPAAAPVKAQSRRRSAPVVEPVAASVEAKARRRRVRKADPASEVGFMTPESAALELARAAKAATTAAMTVVAEAPVAVAPVEEAPAKTRRTRAKKAAEAVVETVEAPVAVEAEAPAAKPRRTRAKKAVEAAPEAVVETAVEAEAPVKPRRTRKKAAEAVVETVEAPVAVEAEAPAAKPRRTRAKKVAEAAPEAVVEAAVEAEAPAAKPRRTRAKKAVASAPEAAVEAEEAPVKPRRTRKKAAEAVVEAVEAPADAEAPAKPRRSRAKKAAVAPEA